MIRRLLVASTLGVLSSALLVSVAIAGSITVPYPAEEPALQLTAASATTIEESAGASVAASTADADADTEAPLLAAACMTPIKERSGLTGSKADRGYARRSD